MKLRSGKSIKQCHAGSSNKNAPLAQPHRAFSIPEIMEQILQYCDVASLKGCRLVSKFWRDSSLQEWRRSAWVQFTSVDVPAGLKSINGFLKFLDSGNSQDIQNLYANFWPKVSFTLTEGSTHRTFWSVIGSRIKSLKVHSCNFQNQDLLHDLLFKHCPNTQHLDIGNFTVVDFVKQRDFQNQDITRFGENTNLKSLSIHCGAFSCLKMSWLEFLRCFPSPVVLTLSYVKEKETVDSIFSAICTIRESYPNSFKLKHLSCKIDSIKSTGTFPSQLLKYLLNPDIQLRSLSINVDVDDAEAALHEILSVQGATLLMLALEARVTRLDPTKCFPLSIKHQQGLQGALTNLQQLKLGYSPVFGSMEYLKFMPNLTRLSVHDISVSRTVALAGVSATNFSKMRNVKLSRCLELQVESCAAMEKLGHLMMMMIRWLPNVERLRMAMDNDIFASVCENWRNLTSLEVIMNAVDECGFTGFDMQTVGKINKRKGKLSKITEFTQRPNISILKHLRKLSLVNSPRHRETSFSYAAAIFGIEQLPNLHYVNLEGISFEENVLLKSFSKIEGSTTTYRRDLS